MTPRTSTTGEFWTRFAIASLAAWRITHLLAHEDGPGDVIYRLRTLAGRGFWGRLMDCSYCLSLWVAAPFAPLVNTWDSLDGAGHLDRAIGRGVSIGTGHGGSE